MHLWWIFCVKLWSVRRKHIVYEEVCHIIGFAQTDSFEHLLDSTCTPLYHFWFTLHLKIFKNSNSRKFIKTTYISFLMKPIQNQKPLSVNFPFHIRTNRTGPYDSYPSGECLTVKPQQNDCPDLGPRFILESRG